MARSNTFPEMKEDNTDIRQVLIQTARGAFLEKGYKAVSMREISEKSGVGLSNIYNYFESKDELFKVVLTPFMNSFEKMMIKHSEVSTDTAVDMYTSEKFQRETIRAFLKIFQQYRPELKLLFYASQGSCFENYCETLIDSNTRFSLEYMRLMQEKNPHLSIDISTFFIHVTCVWWVNLLKEIAGHDELTDDEIECFISEYVRYGAAGWEAIFKGCQKNRIHNTINN